jgi:hypothetical protein
MTASEHDRGRAAMPAGQLDLTRLVLSRAIHRAGSTPMGRPVSHPGDRTDGVPKISVAAVHLCD